MGVWGHLADCGPELLSLLGLSKHQAVWEQGLSGQTFLTVLWRDTRPHFAQWQGPQTDL